MHGRYHVDRQLTSYEFKSEPLHYNVNCSYTFFLVLMNLKPNDATKVCVC